jgi:hypothetical protein
MSMRIAVAGLILTVLAGTAAAEPGDWREWPVRSGDNASKGTWTLIDENDLFGGTDRNYTNGLQISWLSAKNDLPPAIDWASDRLSFLAKPGADWRYGFVAGQTMYTPNDITVATPQPGERPYAGWLFGGLSLTADSGDRLDTIELHAGVVGPASGAEFVQRNWHAQIGSPDPKGWDHQLANEPGLMLVYERKWRNLADFGFLGLGADGLRSRQRAHPRGGRCHRAPRQGSGGRFRPAAHPSRTRRRRLFRALQRLLLVPVRRCRGPGGRPQHLPRRQHVPGLPQRRQGAVRR